MRCVSEHLRYIPPLYVMCLESLANLLVMVNFALNFLIYVTVSQEFKTTLQKLCCNLRLRNVDSFNESFMRRT